MQASGKLPTGNQVRAGVHELRLDTPDQRVAGGWRDRTIARHAQRGMEQLVAIEILGATLASFGYAYLGWLEPFVGGESPAARRALAASAHVVAGKPRVQDA